MKQLHEYDTPETELTTSYEGNWDTKALRMGARSRNLEQRLAACREFIAHATAYYLVEPSDQKKALDILALTAPEP
jgi:uncharacterized protein involved in tolerance to divalent cations